MKKFFAYFIIALVAMVTANTPVFARYEPIEKAFEIRTMSDSTKVLYAKGKPFKGTRIQMLGKVQTILGQPKEKYLMLLNQEGTGTGLGKPDNRYLLFYNPHTKQWQVIAESYMLGGTIIGAFDPGADIYSVEVFIQDQQPQAVEQKFVPKP